MASLQHRFSAWRLALAPSQSICSKRCCWWRVKLGESPTPASSRARRWWMLKESIASFLSAGISGRLGRLWS